jgi:hypothetical protein
MADRVVERECYTEAALVKALEEEWWAISQETIQKLYKRIPERMQLVADNDGGRFRLPGW